MRSRPSSSSDSGRGGEIVVPVTAARTGCQPFVRLSSTDAATSSSAAAMPATSHGLTVPSRSAARTR